MFEKLGPYKIEKLLGRGGMGTVYLGQHESTGERAAIKALAMTLADDTNFRARFLAEIETLKQLHHPNIVQMIGDGEEDGQLFFVMELVEGPTLQEQLQSGHIFTWQEVIQIGVDICEALKHAHASGVFHRDLKPANLLRLPNGSIKLTDFGIAKLWGATHRTADGSVVGTADYMAPEQADGRPVTERTDLYSLGAVMFTLLARRTPFAGGTLPQVIHKLRYEEAPSVRRYAPHTPEELDKLIEELLRKEPQQRVKTALMLVNRLRAMEHGLKAREQVDSPHESDTRISSANPDDGGATKAGGLARKPDTKVAPTFAERDVGPRDYSWNDATVVNAGGSASDSATGADAQAPGTLADSGLPRSRFSTLDEQERKRAFNRAQGPIDTGPSRRSVIALALSIVGVIALCAWGFLPPSADTLYRRIQQTKLEQSTADARDDIDVFLARFPDDPRHAEIDGLRMDVENEWLESRLRIRNRKNEHEMQDYEKRWLAAYQMKSKQPEKARAEFAAILADFGQVPTTEALAKVLAATKHELHRAAK